MSTKRKTPSKLAPPVLKQTAKQPLKSRIDESRTIVSTGKSVAARDIPSQDTIEISSDDSAADDSSSEADDDQPAPTPQAQKSDKSVFTKSKPLPNGKDDSPDDAPDSGPQSPTLGELARSRIVDVQAQLQQQQQGSSTALTPAGGHSLAPPSLQSLGTVLTQALRSDDTELLESCLQTTDLAVVRATIQRLDSGLAAALLARLASRMHRRPGRASSLLAWVQWTLIAHGGALAAQPDLHRKLAELNRVLEERARGLNSLLVLKGKLDMLEAQMQLRRGGRGGADKADDEEEQARNVVYVEGEEDAKAAVEADDQFDVSNINGVDSDEEDDEEDDSEEDDDMGAAATAGEALDDDEVDFDDVDDESGEDDSDVEAAAPPAKVQKTSAAFAKRR